MKKARIEIEVTEHAVDIALIIDGTEVARQRSVPNSMGYETEGSDFSEQVTNEDHKELARIIDDQMGFIPLDLFAAFKD